MRKQIAAANWKMNLTYQTGEELLDKVINAGIKLKGQQQAIFALPFPYLQMAMEKTKGVDGFEIAAQNCHHKKSGAYTGEVSAEMLGSINVSYCIVGHSERREFNHESNQVLADKVDLCFQNKITPIFCCGESLRIRDSGQQDDYVAVQLNESLFHLPEEEVRTIIIAYEPIWAIGTGKTASTEQAQEMHLHIRSILAGKYGEETASQIPILYGGSVKASNAIELFSCEDVDGGLVGGASLVANDFVEIMRALS